LRTEVESNPETSILLGAQQKMAQVLNPTWSMERQWLTCVRSAHCTPPRHSVPLPWRGFAYLLEAEYLGHAWNLFTSLPGVSYNKLQTGRACVIAKQGRKDLVSR